MKFTARPAANISAVTFIELLIVIVIVGIIAGLAIPNFKKTFDNLELENFGRDVFYLCQYLQGTSASKAQIHCLNIDLDKGEFQGCLRQGNDCLPLTGQFAKAYAAPRETVITLEPDNRTQVYFYPDASADNLKITLENKHKKQVIVNIQGAEIAIQVQ